MRFNPVVCLALLAHVGCVVGDRGNMPAIDDGSAAGRTQALMAVYKRWLHAPPNDRDALRDDLVATAQARRALLVQVIADDPAEMVRVAIPEHKQATMPAEVVALLEKRHELEGVLEVYVEDYADGTHRMRRFLRTDLGDRLELQISGEDSWYGGVRVRASGWLLDHGDGLLGELAIADPGQDLVLVEEVEQPTILAAAAGLPNTLGAQHTLVILVNFQNDPTNKPWTVAQAQSEVFGATSDFFRDNSSQQTWLTGTVAGWYTIPVDNTNCDGFDIQNHARAAAQAAGYDLAAYQRFVFAFPTNSGCGYAGMGQVGAFPSAAWINGSLVLRTLGHEMGHNLGLQHAHALDCGATTLGTSCAAQTYGDTLDIMGYPGTVGHFNTFGKEALGWLSSGNQVSVTNSGSFFVEPSSKATTGPKVLKVRKGTDAVSGLASFYYVEFRQPIGFDSRLTDRGVIDTANIFNGVTIRQVIPTDRNSSYLLDMTPGTTWVDMSDAALTMGKQFYDPAAGVTITTESTTSEAALVTISFGGQTCTRSSPIITLSPAVSPWLAAGTAYTYQVNVTNKDSSSCSSSQFTMSAGKPAGWDATVGSSVLTLSPGASASTTLKITAASTATDGFYSISAIASGNGFSATASGTFVVDNPTMDRAPVAVDDLAELTIVQAITISVLANDSDPDGDPLQIVATSRPSKGSVTINANGTLTYVPGKRFKTSDRFSYTISDGTSSATADVTVRRVSSSW